MEIDQPTFAMSEAPKIIQVAERRLETMEHSEQHYFNR